MELRAGYKQTEGGVIPEEWNPLTIGEVVTFSGGSQPPRSTFIFHEKDGYIRLVQIRDYKSNDHATYIPEYLVNKKCAPDEIMIGRYGPPIFQILRGIEGAYNVALIKAIPSRIINKEYLYFFLQGDKLFYHMDMLSQRSSGQTGVDLPALKVYPIPLPPLPEQRAIATALSDVDSFIFSLGRMIAKKRDMKQATMQELLTGKRRLPGFNGEWKVNRFSEVLSRINAKEHQIQASDYQVTGDYPVVDQGKDRVIGYSDREDKRLQCPYGGVIVFGDHTCIVKFIDFDFIVGADGTQVLTARSGQCTRFLCYQLEHSGIPTTGYNRHFKFIKERSFVVPPFAEQTAIATILSDMDADIATMEQKLDKTRMLKQGMMQELLTGRIRLV